MLMKLIAVIDYIGELFSYDGLNRLMFMKEALEVGQKSQD